MANRDPATTPWGNIPCHRVPVAECRSVTAKVRRLLALRKGNSEDELLGERSARDWARAMLGGTNGPGDLSSVLGMGARLARRAQTR